MHEISSNVKTHGIALELIVHRLLAYVLLQSFDTVVCAAPFDAGITVGDKGALENLMGVIEIKVVDYPVAEHGSEHLAFFRIVDDEAVRWSWLIASREQIVTKCVEVVLQVSLEFLHIGHLALMAGSVLKSDVEVEQQPLACQCESHNM